MKERGRRRERVEAKGEGTDGCLKTREVWDQRKSPCVRRLPIIGRIMPPHPL